MFGPRQQNTGDRPHGVTNTYIHTCTHHRPLPPHWGSPGRRGSGNGVGRQGGLGSLKKATRQTKQLAGDRADTHRKGLQEEHTQTQGGNAIQSMQLECHRSLPAPPRMFWLGCSWVAAGRDTMALVPRSHWVWGFDGPSASCSVVSNMAWAVVTGRKCPSG